MAEELIRRLAESYLTARHPLGGVVAHQRGHEADRPLQARAGADPGDPDPQLREGERVPHAH